MELPPYRTPTLKGLLIHTWERTWQYVKKAGTVLLAVSLVVWALMSFPGLSRGAGGALRPTGQPGPGPKARQEVANQRAAAALSATVAGRLGRALTVLTDPLGFDWRTNVALVGGLAAKEVIVSTMGTAYSLGQGTKKGADAEPLARRLAASSSWSPLSAVALMIFVMIYSPCVATLAVIRRETGTWRWALFAMLHHTLLAYVLALLVYQGGRLLGLG